MTLRVAVDFGTSNTCAAMSVSGAGAQVVTVDGAALLPSAVYAAPDGQLFVGQEAQRQAAIDPARYEPHPKRRLDEGELLLGDRVVPVTEVVRAVLGRILTEARRAAAGAPVDCLVLTHPADWGPVRPAVLRNAAQPLAREVVLIPEPVAATLFYLTECSPAGFAAAGISRAGLPAPAGPAGASGASGVLAVLDLGAGTVDASVVRHPVAAGPGRARSAQSADFTILAARGDSGFGGADLDQLLLEHVGAICAPADPAAWRALIGGRELADRRRRRVLRDDVRTAKETLSRHSYADVPLPPPLRDVHVTRAELERLIRPALNTPVALLEAVLLEAGYRPGAPEPPAVFLVGGSSRIPLVARLVQERLGITPRSLDVPETVTARGALGLRPVSGPVRCRRAGAAHRHSRVLLLAAAVLVAGLVGVLVAGLLAWGDRAGGPAVDRLSRYGYSFGLVGGWEPAGGDESLREVRLLPAGADGPEAVLVQENRLSYDSDAEPARPRRELREQIADTGRHGAGRYTGFDPRASFAGRDVVYYRERAADGSTVDWYVLLDGRVQISVGCRYTPAGAASVERACREVVRTLRVH